MKTIVKHLQRANDRCAVSLTAFTRFFRYILCGLTVFGVLFWAIVISRALKLYSYDGAIAFVVCWSCSLFCGVAIKRSFELDLELLARETHGEKVSK